MSRSLGDCLSHTVGMLSSLSSISRRDLDPYGPWAGADGQGQGDCDRHGRSLGVCDQHRCHWCHQQLQELSGMWRGEFFEMDVGGCQYVVLNGMEEVVLHREGCRRHHDHRGLLGGQRRWRNDWQCFLILFLCYLGYFTFVVNLRFLFVCCRYSVFALNAFPWFALLSQWVSFQFFMLFLNSAFSMFISLRSGPLRHSFCFTMSLCTIILQRKTFIFNTSLLLLLFALYNNLPPSAFLGRFPLLISAL